MVLFDRLIQPIWEISPYPIAVIGLDGDPEQRKFVYANPAFAALTRYSRAELVDRPTAILNGPKTSPALIAECRAQVAKGLPSELVFVHYRKDGSEYLARSTVAPLVEPDGSTQFLMWIETILPAAIEAGDSASETAAGGAVLVPLILPMPLREFPGGQLPKHLPSHPELDALQALWTSLRGKRSLPERADFDLRTVRRWATHLSVATVTPEGRFQFRLFGTELARVYGRDLTGRFLDELVPRDLWSVITLHYREAVKTRLPLFAPISIANGQWYNEVSRLLLPLGSGGEEVAFVMGADYPRTAYS